MANEDGTVWVSFNGEIYNHTALRPGLEARGHRFASRTDTEVIVHLWEEEGIRCVEHLDGMFALAIFDARTGELFLARDRLGKKPLYYAQPPGGFVFGSEIKALLEHPAISPGARRGGLPPLPDLRLHAGAADDVRGRAQARARRADAGQARRHDGLRRLLVADGRAADGGARRDERGRAAASGCSSSCAARSPSA